MSGRGRYFELVAILGPFAVVAAVRLLTGAGLASAPASPVPAPAVQAEHERRPGPLSAAQMRAAAWLDGLQSAEALPSPMETPAEPAERGGPAPEPARPMPKPFKLSAVMGSAAGGSMAMIDGKVYRVDDEVAPGCRLIAIDVHECAADVRMADGTVVRIQRER